MKIFNIAHHYAAHHYLIKGITANAYIPIARGSPYPLLKEFRGTILKYYVDQQTKLCIAKAILFSVADIMSAVDPLQFYVGVAA